jgi:hypothetical protein
VRGRIELHRLRLDALLARLEAFAEPEPTAREQLIERVRNLRARGMTIKEIGSYLGKDYRGVGVIVYNLALPSFPRMLSLAEREAQDAVIRDLYLSGMTGRDIGLRVGLRVQAVFERVWKMNLPRRRPEGRRRHG